MVFFAWKLHVFFKKGVFRYLIVQKGKFFFMTVMGRNGKNEPLMQVVCIGGSR